MVVATLLSLGSMLSLFATVGLMPALAPQGRSIRQPERVMFVTPGRLPMQQPRPPRSSNGKAAAPRASRAALAAAPVGGTPPAPRDSTVAARRTTGDASGAAAAGGAGATTRAVAGAASPGAGPSLGPFAARPVTGRGALPPARARDSIAAALGASVPELARRRVKTTGERDAEWRVVAAANREARASGRPAPTGDPTKAGAQMGGASISAPLFSPGPSKEKRMRDSLAWKQNAILFARLQARLDSVRLEAARGDSVRREAARRGAASRETLPPSQSSSL